MNSDRENQRIGRTRKRQRHTECSKTEIRSRDIQTEGREGEGRERKRNRKTDQ